MGKLFVFSKLMLTALTFKVSGKGFLSKQPSPDTCVGLMDPLHHPLL